MWYMWRWATGASSNIRGRFLKQNVQARDSKSRNESRCIKYCLGFITKFRFRYFYLCFGHRTLHASTLACEWLKQLYVQFIFNFNNQPVFGTYVNDTNMSQFADKAQRFFNTKIVLIGIVYGHDHDHLCDMDSYTRKNIYNIRTHKDHFIVAWLRSCRWYGENY